MRRCRPLLGTFVELRFRHAREHEATTAAERAFKAVERVGRLMSFHDSESELSRLNREAHLHAVQVDALTCEVLEAALDLHRRSEGRFDIAVAPALQRWGLLPIHAGTGQMSEDAGVSAHIVLERGRRVRFLRPLRIDLGGIAKGFAVDLAVEQLRAAGVSAGVVNAGGDMRAFGDQAFPLSLRHPAHPEVLVPAGILRDEAAATSSGCFAQTSWRGHVVSHLVDTRSGSSFPPDRGVTVLAPSCMLADALCKVALHGDEAATEILEHYGARVLEPHSLIPSDAN